MLANRVDEREYRQGCVGGGDAVIGARRADVPLDSAGFIELPFYTSLASHKINHDKLDDSARAVLGLYEIRPSDPEAASCRIQIHGNALTSSE